MRRIAELADAILGSLLLARVTGLEPATSGVTGRRSNQLSYTRSGRAQRLGWAEVGVKRESRRHRRPYPTVVVRRFLEMSTGP